MRPILFYVAALTGSVASAAERPEREPRDPRAMEEAVAVQVLLDRANFGPGKIDGHYGDFTKKALDRYRRAKGGSAPQPAAEAPPPRDVAAQTGSSQTASTGAPAPGDNRAATAALPEPDPQSLTSTSTGKRETVPASTNETPPAKGKTKETKRAETAPAVDVSDLDLKSIGNVFVEYTVAEADVQSVGELPETPAAKAKLKWLPYASVAEAVAERFHMDVDFLEELNPGKTKNLRAGDVVRVPNVEPFELATVKNLKPGTPLNAQAANADEGGQDAEGENEDAKKKDREGTAKKNEKGKDKAAKSENEAQEAASPNVAVVVNKDENMLEVLEGEKLVAAFPVTVGSSETASPVGEWKVRGVAKLPEFRWDEKMLKEGERGSEFHMLPPGPNSPVGVIWIALNKKGVGLHGSDSPDAIGRNVSHGCIRLANWDVLKLATMVKAGVPVSIR